MVNAGKSNLTIRLATEADVPALLRFIAEMGFNPRTERTRRGLSMGAMTAWDGPRLIGAIPVEPRILQAGGGGVIGVLHETVVAVHPEHRAAGVGTRLQMALCDDRLFRGTGGPPVSFGEKKLGEKKWGEGHGTSDEICSKPDVLTVFREDPSSAAYRWYLKCGFTPVLRIESFFADRPQEIASGDYRLIEHGSTGQGKGSRDEGTQARCVASRGRTDRISLRPELECGAGAAAAAWERSHGHAGGPVSRLHRPIVPWLGVHPYGGRYRFVWVVSAAGWAEGHALLGIGPMHAASDRADILQLAGDAEKFVRLASHACADQGWTPLRWPVAAIGPEANIAGRLGMSSRWSFDMLCKSRFGASLPDTTGWTYSGLDFA